MSVRRAPQPASTNAAINANQLRTDIENMRYAAAMAEQPIGESAEHAALFESLTETTRAPR